MSLDAPLHTKAQQAPLCASTAWQAWVLMQDQDAQATTITLP